jgi:hypothetical protein
MTADKHRWLQAGLVAAGMGAALIAGPGLAAASADDGSDHTATGADRPSSSAATHTRGPARQATGSASSTARPASAARPSAVTKSVDLTVPESISRPARVPRPSPNRAAEGAASGNTVVARTAAAGTIAVEAPSANSSTAGATEAVAVAKDPGPIRAAIAAAEAYVYGYPLMEYQRVRQTVGAVNTLYSLTSLANPDVDPIWTALGGGKRPNTDTFYSLAELDLSSGPVVLSIPDMGSRYFSFQLTDPYTNVSGYIGSRTTGFAPGTYAITWSGGPQVDVPGAQTVVVPYSSMLALGRTLAGDEADQQSAIALMKQYSLTPSGGTVSPVIPIPKPGLSYLDAISAAMEFNPPPAIDAPILAKMAQIGVGPGLRVVDADLSFFSRVAADLAVQATAALLPLLAGVNQYVAALGNRGWATPSSDIGNYGTDYLLRAGVAEVGLLANSREEAVYSAGLLSGNLLPLAGWKTPYVLHFAPGQEPPVDGFWSVTVYDSAGLLVPNAEHRYSVSSSRPDELVRRPDGSIDIIFSPRDPGDPGANWLKTPLGGFNAYLRMYVPDQSVLDGAWTVPAIVRRR